MIPFTTLSPVKFLTAFQISLLLTTLLFSLRWELCTGLKNGEISMNKHCSYAKLLKESEASINSSHIPIPTIGSGVIISRDTVLTLGSVVSNERYSEVYRIVAGKDETEQYVRVKKIDLLETRSVYFAVLHISPTLEDIIPTGTISVEGWEYAEESNGSQNSFRKVDLAIVNNSICSAEYKEWDEKDSLCGLTLGENALLCKEDNGAGAMCKIGEENVLCALVLNNFDSGCQRWPPATFVLVTQSIVKNISNKETAEKGVSERIPLEKTEKANIGSKGMWEVSVSILVIAIIVLGFIKYKCRKKGHLKPEGDTANDALKDKYDGMDDDLVA